MIQVIIADEVLIDRKQLRKILEHNGIDVVSESSNGIHAFNEYRIFKPDLIFLALNLPMMDGITTMKRIKEAYDEAKVVVVGEEESRRHIFEGLELGADEYIMKPYNQTQIEKVIHKILRDFEQLKVK